MFFLLLILSFTNSDPAEGVTTTDSIEKGINSDIIDTTKSDLIEKSTNPVIVDTTISDLNNEATNKDAVDNTSSDLSDKPKNSEELDDTTNSDLNDKDTNSERLSEGLTNEVIIGNKTDEVDEIAFRQVSQFQIDIKLKRIIFFFFGIVFKPIKAGAFLKIKTHLTKEVGDPMEKEVVCKANEAVKSENGEQKQAELECTIDVEKPEEFNGLEVVSSDSISGIPTNPNLLNPAKVDELIEIGEIKDYSKKENKEEEIPVFNATSLDTERSEETGIFYINGAVPPNFELKKKFEFELKLISGEKVICTIPKVSPGKKEIKIECVIQEAFNGKIVISPCAAFDGYNEIIRLNKIETEKSLNLPNGKEHKLDNLFSLDLTFGQLCGFAPGKNLLSFYFVGFISKLIKKGETIKMMVNLLKNGIPVEEEAECIAIEEVDPKGAQGQVQFDCKVDNVEKPEEFEGLELISSEEVSGIPTDPDLLNPAKVDELIKENQIENYTSPEFKKQTIPVFNATSLDTTNSKDTGIFYINGIVPPTFESKKKIEFEVMLLSGEKAICTLPKISKNQNEIKIECVLQEELKDTKIYIQSFSACEGYKQLFRFNKIESKEKVTIANGREYKINLLFNIDLLFGQLSRFNFEPKKKEITFVLVGFVTEEIKKDEEIKLDVKLFIKNNKNDDDDDDDDDEDDDDDDEEEDDEEEEAICKPKETKPIGKQKIVIFECKIEDLDDKKEYIGIEILDSDQITGIPADKKLRNPAKVDKLIEEGAIQNYTSPDFEKKEIQVFNATSIDTTNSAKTGIFIINGLLPPGFVLKKRFEFEVLLMTGEKAICTFPKVSGDKTEIQIECILQKKLIDTQIIIQQFCALAGSNELLRFTKVCSKNKVNIANGKLKKLDRLFGLWLSFGQLNHFLKKPDLKLISFLFYGIVSQPITKDYSISMTVNLLNQNGIEEEEEANCIAKEEIIPKEDESPKVQFECKVEGIENPNNYAGLELVSSEEISGIPTDPDLLNPATVDELIALGEIKNYTSNENIAPLFNATFIDTNDSEKTGVFFIEGDLLSEYKPKKPIEFEIVLMTGEKVKCRLPKKDLKGKIKLECVSQEELVDVKIMIQQFVALDGFDEIIKISKISTDKEVKVGNGKEIKLKKIFNNILSFGQLRGFNPKKDKKMISFVFVGFANQPIKKEENITMTVNLIKKENDETQEEEVNCTAKADITPKSGKQKLVDFECNVENLDNPENYKDLELVKSEDINSIPEEPDLLNPGVVDTLIIEGEIRNYTLDEEKEKLESLPILNATSIVTTNSSNTGVFTIKGKFLSEVTLDEDFVFDITLASGQKAECKLPKNNTKNVVKIECELQEELNNAILMIPKGSLFDGYNEKIKINKISTPKAVTVANGKQVKLDKKFNSTLSFRQTNKFGFDPNSKMITFVIAAFANKPITTKDKITVDVSLNSPLESNKTEAICTAEKDIKELKKPKEPVTLKCEVQNDTEILSLDIEDSKDMTNIPEDPKLKNPTKTDNLISANEIEEASDSNANALPNFNATNIDTTGSINTGKFKIEGKPLDDIVKEFVFNLTLVTGENAICKLPKSKKNDEKVAIECELDGTLEKTEIMIPETTVKSGYKEIFNLNKIKSKRPVSCANGKFKKMEKKLENKITFRQISHFKPDGKNIKFTFTAFILKTMKKGDSVNMNVTLDKGDKTFSSQKASCSLKNDVTFSNEPTSEDFECTIENVDNADKCTGVELVDSDVVSGIPSDPNMTNTSVVDELIEKGDIKDLTLDENKKEIPLTFTPSTFNGLGCRSSGVFTIKGKLNKKLDKHLRFNLPLSYPSIDTKCTVPESAEGEEVDIICQTKSPFGKSKIVIEPLTVSKNNSEVISFLSTSSNEEIACEDYQAVSLKKKRKKFKAPFSFRQTQKFENKNGVIKFILYVLKKEEATTIPSSIEIKVRPVKSNKRRRLDTADGFIPINMDCTPANTNSELIQLSCSGNGDSSATGAIILDSDDISGIPLNESDSNPAVVDALIDEGKLEVDCSKGGCSLPKFENGKFDELDSTFYINGDINGNNIENSSIFNLSIFPDSYGDCQINNETKKIECYNKEEIDNSLVLIEESVVKDSNGKELFLLKSGVKSDSDDISLLATDKVHLNSKEGEEDTNKESSSPSTSSPSSAPSTSPANATNPVESFKNNYFSKASGNSGLSGGAIAGIIIACIVAVIVVAGIAYFIKSSGKKAVQQVETIQLGNTNEIGTSVGHFNSAV